MADRERPNLLISPLTFSLLSIIYCLSSMCSALNNTVKRNFIEERLQQTGVGKCCELFYLFGTAVAMHGYVKRIQLKQKPDHGQLFLFAHQNTFTHQRLGLFTFAEHNELR